MERYRISRRVAILILAVSSLVACGPGERQVDLSATNAAVEAASDRIVRVDASHNSVSGLGTSVTYELRFDSKKPASIEDLDAIVKAIWQNVPFEPNDIAIAAYADDAHEVPVDLRVAAEGLTPLYTTPFRSGGVIVIGMEQRYGERED